LSGQKIVKKRLDRLPILWYSIGKIRETTLFDRLSKVIKAKTSGTMKLAITSKELKTLSWWKGRKGRNV